MKKIASLLLMVVALSLFLIPAIAQDNTGDDVPIEFSGTVDAIDGTTITVSGLTVDISSLDSAVIAVLENGMEITISGNLEGTVVIAITVDLPDDVEPVPTDSPDDDDQGDDDDDTPTSGDNGISIQIFVSANGGTTWVSADNDVEAETDDELLVRFIVLNSSGFLLTGIDLSGTSFDISGCDIPTDLDDGADFDCTVPLVFIGGADGLALVVVLAGDLEGVVITISQDVNIQEDDDDADDDDGVVIVIEGPVTAIEANHVTIFNFTIVVADDDPILTVIQIGDVLRIEGDWDDNQPFIIAIIVVFVNVDVFIFEGDVWRDAGNCNNAPPPWAPANGWRRRCQSNNGGGSGGSGGSNGGGRGRGRSGRGSS